MPPFGASNRVTLVAPDPPTRDREACGSGFASLHVLMTVNSAWNIWNFRRPVVSALLANGHAVTVLAPPDDSVPLLQAMGCRFEPLAMDVKGLNPLRSLALIRRLRRNFMELRVDFHQELTRDFRRELTRLSGMFRFGGGGQGPTFPLRGFGFMR